MSQITTHVLDTSSGKPAKGIAVILEHGVAGSWNKIGEGTSDKDGRISDLCKEEVQPGSYRIIFFVADYFKAENRKCFYPKVCIEFEITDATHYHVPLLLNPFGYTTYRGS